jgi:predicted Rossmann-fold nucleotide-binding protein
MIVGVMASGDEALAKMHEKLAQTVGSSIAELGFHLLTGGGGGLMETVGQAFLSSKQELAKAKKPTGSLRSILRAKKLLRHHDMLGFSWNELPQF